MKLIQSTVDPTLAWTFDEKLPDVFDHDGHTYRYLGRFVNKGAPCEVWQSKSYLPKTIHSYITKPCKGDCQKCTRQPLDLGDWVK